MDAHAWLGVLSPNRLGPAGGTFPLDDDVNDVFQKDADRILSASAFRRLQGKTQVYPLPDTDFVRNRLTHTYEVAQIGQSIARGISRALGLDSANAESLSQLVFNGCLLHDIGNPPFGHSGESSIREFFSKDGRDLELVRYARKHEAYRLDLSRFDGNAQGFRVAVCLSGWKRRGGLRLSAATLTTMVKYPFSSSAAAAALGKFGFMETERSFAIDVFRSCGLQDPLRGILLRSPLSVIVEAADDIAYLTADLQDAYRCRDLGFEATRAMLQALSSEDELRSFDQLDGSRKDYEDDVIGYLRSAAVSRMTKAAASSLLPLFQKGVELPAGDTFDIWRNPFVAERYKAIADGEATIRAASAQLFYRGKRKMALQVAGGRIIKFVLRMQIAALQEILVEVHTLITRDRQRVYADGPGADASPRAISRYVIENVDKFVSREAAQIFWGMPSDAHDVLENIVVDIIEGSLPIDDPLIAFRLIQISLDFVAGTTDRYISEYSRQWGGPHI